MATTAWITVLAQLLTEQRWTVVGAPWQGKDVVFDLLAVPEGADSPWALRLFDEQPGEQAVDMMEQDMLSEGEARMALLIGPLQTHCVGIDVSIDEREIYQILELAGQARQIAWSR